VAGRLAAGSLAAHVGVGLVAGVLALELDAGLVRGTVVVARALGVAPAEGVAQEVWRAGALRPVVHGLAVRILATHALAARAHAAVALTVALLALAALPVRIALMATALERVAYEGWLTSANWPVVLSHLTVGVLSTRSTNLSPGEPSAVSERVSRCSLGAPAYGHVVLHAAISPLATAEATGIHALVVLASPLRPAVTVLVTFSLDAARVGIAVVAW